MEQQRIYCPSCKLENKIGDRFCRHCGRLLIEPDVEAVVFAPPYSAGEDAPILWDDASHDLTRARVVIRAFPPDAQDSSGGVAQRVGEYALEGRTITIGRAQNCDIIFSDDNLTSRRHAILRREDRYYTVADLGSSNGTFLNEIEVREPSPLHHGDRLLIGQHELLFLLEQPQPIAGPSFDAPTALDDAAAEVAADAAPDAPVGEAAVGAGATGEAAAAAVVVAVAQADVALTDNPADTAPEEAAARAQARPTSAPEPAGATAKYASVARLSSEVASSAWRLATPAREGADLDTMRVRLLEASEALTRQAELQSALAERRRRAISEARERLLDVLADLRGDDVSGASHIRPATPAQPVDLIELARQVSADPNNLSYLRALAEHAGEIAEALRAQGPSEGRWLVERAQTVRALEDIHYRLQERE